MVLFDESFALRESMGVGRGDAGGIRIRPGAHIRVEFHVHIDARESDEVPFVDEGVEIGHHITFDVVLPRDDSPALAVLRSFEDLRHIVHRHQFESFGREGRQHMRRVDGGLVRECALRTEIEQLACAHCVSFLVKICLTKSTLSHHRSGNRDHSTG